MSDKNDRYCVLGGAGFIGSNFIRNFLSHIKDTQVINFDKLTYCGRRENLKDFDPSRHVFIQGDISNRQALQAMLHQYKPIIFVNFAAETHVDRSIMSAELFVKTNVLGTLTLLEELKSYFESLSPQDQRRFRFLHVSTDEVFGSCDDGAAAFTEQSPYGPNNPYAASKAAADHLVRSFYKTHNFPSLIVHCSNNYGPHQFPEKLIPLSILNLLQNKPIKLYGDGQQIREWLYVDDCCDAIQAVLLNGQIGESYNIGGENHIKNIDIVHAICNTLEEISHPLNKKISKNIEFITDRKGHDRRYALNCNKIKHTLNWSSSVNFTDGLRKTVEWYLNNFSWIESIKDQQYCEWIEKQYHRQSI